MHRAAGKESGLWTVVALTRGACGQGAVELTDDNFTPGDLHPPDKETEGTGSALPDLGSTDTP